jgi:hypothetical protein
MGDFLDRVSERRNAPVALAHRISLLISKNGKKALIVEAGDDVMMYGALIRRFGVFGRADIFPAEGRGKVISALTALSELGKHDYSYAIIDRDFHFDDPTLMFGDHCYVLDHYSVENLFLDLDTLVEIGYNFLALDPDGAERELWYSSVARFLGSLGNSFIEEHAIAVACLLQKANCNMSNFDISQATSANMDGSFDVLGNASDDFIRLAQINREHITAQNLEKGLRLVCGRPVQSYFRGHYFWTLFVRMFNNFRSELDQSYQQQRRARSRTRAVINERHALEAAMPFAPVPASLERFLRGGLG